MAKSIEGRAKEYADNYIVGDSAVIADLLHKVAEESYTTGASEQHKFDVVKACDVYAKELKEIISILNKIGEMRGIEELGDILSFNGCIRDFQKAMEE